MELGPEQTGAPGRWRATFSLPSTTTAASSARQLVRTLLIAWGLDAIADDAELLTAELFTNALRHAPALRHQLELMADPDHVRLALSDGSAAQPNRREPASSAVDGRGLHIIEAVASNWGVDGHQAGGKLVWVELPLAGQA